MALCYFEEFTQGIQLMTFIWISVTKSNGVRTAMMSEMKGKQTFSSSLDIIKEKNKKESQTKQNETK